MSRGGTVGLVGGALGVAGLPLVAVLAVVALSTGMTAGAATTPTVSSSPVPTAVAGIPPAYLVDVERAGARFGVPWAVVAGIYHQECDFGQSALAGCDPPGTENPAGAQGPGQFLPGTWRTGLAPHEVIAAGPPTVADAQGYATDGDGDGVADPWDPADATASTARLLAADGAASGDVAGAVYAYDHDEAYVRAVLALADRYEQAVGSIPGVPGADPDPGDGSGDDGAGAPIPGADPSALAAVLAFADEQLGDPYRWGGAGPTGWDCSGLVQAAYALAGLSLAHNAAAQYRATAAAAVVPGDSLDPGDLVFFGPSLAAISHVGIVVGDGEMIDAPHTGAVVRVEPYDWSDLIAATRPLG